MIKLIKRIFGVRSENKPQRNSQRILPKVNPVDYIGLTNIEKVKKACIEYDKIGTPFTSKMIYDYLNGLVSIDNVYKCMHKLTKPQMNLSGMLKKVTVLCSDPINNRHRHFYELNKNYTNEQ
jgi:CTP synthase (UTP-ammonia lyase)